MDAFSIFGVRLTNWLYENFHAVIAWTALDAGFLDFAEEALSAIPRTTHPAIPVVAAMLDRLAALREAEKHGAVFPLNVPFADRWTKPHLLDVAKITGRTLERWLAARVEHVDDSLVVLHAAEQRDGGTDHFTLEMDRSDFEQCPTRLASATGNGSGR